MKSVNGPNFPVTIATQNVREKTGRVTRLSVRRLLTKRWY